MEEAIHLSGTIARSSCDTSSSIREVEPSQLIIAVERSVLRCFAHLRHTSESSAHISCTFFFFFFFLVGGQQLLQMLLLLLLLLSMLALNRSTGQPIFSLSVSMTNLAPKAAAAVAAPNNVLSLFICRPEAALLLLPLPDFCRLLDRLYSAGLGFIL